MEELQCTLENGDPGVCCNPAQEANETVPIKAPTRQPIKPVQFPEVSNEEIGKAGEAGVNFVKDMESLEKELSRRKLTAKKKSAEFFIHSFFGSDAKTRKATKDGTIALQTSIEFAVGRRLTPQTTNSLETLDLKNTTLKTLCQSNPTCTEEKYRTADGSCNNIANGDWGKSLTAFNRLIPAEYGDATNSPRVAKNKGELPSARLLSTSVATDRNVEHKRLSYLFVHFGQFVDHDITRSAATTTANGEALMCCGAEFTRNPSLLHPGCFPIPIPPNDRFFASFNMSCMSFVRSAAAPRADCKLGVREQLNQVTAYLDGSAVYGSTAEQTQQLREFSGGRLKVSQINGEEFLPFAGNDTACAAPQGQHCFLAGDGRVNVQLGLTVMQTLWLKEHNRIARLLSSINKQWNDETLFQETRRIIDAQFQHITYNEFLPLVLGRSVSKFFGLNLLSKGFLNKYDKNLNPTIVSDFAAAAFRLHSTISPNLQLRSGRQVVAEVPIVDTFFDPSLLERRSVYDLLLNGFGSQPSQTFDNFFTKQITQFLFSPSRNQPGMDLVSLNIQRGRDHGVPDYNTWRAACGLPKLRNFKDLERFIDKNVAQLFSRLYQSVDDIDLFIAGVAETPLKGAIVGPTFACIIGEQFRRLKYGDRFWYENGNFKNSFTKMQQLALVQPYIWNRRISCRRIPGINLQHWKSK
ncbi:chorion peroxidase-like protein [Leptotrombidium deliense]|uniref:Chorion peroxidase-like protein n=1 Tax=Leptotrombidium deliense TaxID=299467 RepID=A0A443S5E3_9ACAR|nr:chorion peroxidase-like protein [Leptotrombidium deliense]